MTESEGSHFRNLCTRLRSIFHVEHLTELIKIEELYGPLDPDSELIQLVPLSENEKESRTGQLVDRLSSLLYSAHYQRLTRDELQHAIELSSEWGVKLDVDFNVFDRLEVFARGYQMVEVTRRRWWKLFFKETVMLPEFHRLVMVFGLKENKRIGKEMSTEAIYLKIFKNIPETDLEVLLPGSRVRLSRWDHGRTLLPTISGIAFMLYKYRMGILFIGLVTASAFYMWAFSIALLVGFVIKSVLTYFRTKEAHQFNLTKNLYLKNLDNNAGVLYRVLNEAQEQEFCETVLGYTMLWQHGGPEGLTESRIDELAEEFLLTSTEKSVDFDLHDSLGKLARLGLASYSSNGSWFATDISVAPERLNQNWTKLFHERAKRKRKRDSHIELDDVEDLFSGE